MYPVVNGASTKHRPELGCFPRWPTPGRLVYTSPPNVNTITIIWTYIKRAWWEFRYCTILMESWLKRSSKASLKADDPKTTFTSSYCHNDQTMHGEHLVWTHLLEAGLAWVQISRPQQNNLIFTKSQYFGIGEMFERAAMVTDRCGWWSLKLFLPAAHDNQSLEEAGNAWDINGLLLSFFKLQIVLCHVLLMYWSGRWLGALLAFLAFFVALLWLSPKVENFLENWSRWVPRLKPVRKAGPEWPFFLQKENQTDPYTFPPDRK